MLDPHTTPDLYVIVKSLLQLCTVTTNEYNGGVAYLNAKNYELRILLE